MSTYLFVLGKNWILSIAELITCLDNYGFTASVIDHSRNVAVVKTEIGLSDEQLLDIQSALGGCYKTGRVVESYDLSVAEGAFPASGGIDREKRKFLQSCAWIEGVWRNVTDESIKFGVSTYEDAGKSTVDLTKLTLGLDESIKGRLVKMGARKAVYYAYEEPDRRKPERPNTALWPQTIARHRLLHPPNAEILAALTAKSLYLAKSVAVYDSLLQQHRDESRPFVAAEITTSPKLCRALLNFAGAKSGHLVLDPFCGTGTILMEAALLDMRGFGIDINPEAVEGARSNLRWLESELDDSIDFTVVRGDARNASQIVKRPVDAVAFEPDLGPVLKERPATEAALKILRDLTVLYRDTLRSVALCMRPGGRVGMTVPVINSTGGPVSIDLEVMIEGTGFTLCRFLPKDKLSEDQTANPRSRIRPDRERLPERKMGQIVQREVVMLIRS